MFESYIRGVFYYNYSNCHQLHTVALSFLPYAAGKQQFEGKMPKIGHFHFSSRSQRDKNFLFCRNSHLSAIIIQMMKLLIHFGRNYAN